MLVPFFERNGTRRSAKLPGECSSTSRRKFEHPAAVKREPEAEARMIGSTISHYKILGKLGEGGMGVVYKAQDMKLNRTVALKFLPQHSAVTEKDTLRFQQEAQTAATLNHPNICIIYDIKEQDGQQFIVMEYVDGETLRQKFQPSIARIDTVLGYATQMCEALEHAHTKGVVHRDIKADNIMINSSNQVKVMDFGLAKLKGALKLTRSSSTVGTLAYMAPEQLQGGESDARSDIFSFGVLLFEMLTGRVPFRGEHEAAMMYSILNEEPESLLKHRPDASPELVHVIKRALEKDPEDRYQNIHDALIDLRRLKKESSKIYRSAIQPTAPPASAPVDEEQAVPAPVSKQQQIPTTSVTINIPRMSGRSFLWPGVVLGVLVLAVAGYFLFLKPATTNGERVPIVVADFVNETKEPELDGLSGMLITALEQSRRLDVLPRARMFDILKLLGKNNVERVDESLGKEICNQAGITSLLTASIRKFGKVYTIDMKVLDPKGGKYLFTATETGEGQESIPSLLDKLSKKTREDFKENRTEIQAASKNVAEVTTSNMEAYQHFFRGQQLMNEVKWVEAQEEYRKAVALDSTFGLAYYGLAYAISWQSGAQAEVKGPIQKALALIDRIPEKERYLLRAVDAENTSGFAAGIVILKEMEKVYPTDKEMLYNIGDWSYHAGQRDAAKDYLEKVLGMDPTMERALEHLTWTYRDMGQSDKMLEIAKRYVSASGSTEAYVLLRDGYVSVGQFDQAMKTMQSARDLFPKRYEFTGSIAQLFRYQGKYDEAEKELKNLVSESQPSEAKGTGYSGLMSFYLNTGRVRDALRASDERMKLYWSAKDTVGVIQLSMQRGFSILWMRKDTKSAQKEIDVAVKYEAEKRPQTKTNLGVWYAYQGDVEAVNKLTSSFRLAQQAILSIAYGAKHDCGQAEAYLDSTQGGLPTTAKILCLYPLAVCQYDGSQTDKALETVNKLLAFKELPSAGEYARTLFLLGKIYEKKGEKSLAMENYEKFLTIWKDADKDLPDYVDVKSRLAKLKGIASK
jgi:serine/threonine protein kinase/tetratricopeptide (TPR) repeat protein